MGGETPTPMPSERNTLVSKKASKNKNNTFKQYESIYQIIYWIDKDINNKENLQHQKYFKSQLGNFMLKTYKNIQEFFSEIIQIKFKIIFVVVSGDLYSDYYFELKKIRKELTSVLLTIIFTSKQFKKILLKEEENKYEIKPEILNSIKDSYYNYGGVTADKDDVVNFIKAFLGLKYKPDLDYSNALTFEMIEDNNYEQLIFPSLFGNIEMRENYIEEEDIDNFNDLLIKKHDYTVRGISELITLYKKIGNIPLELMTKYWIRYYTSESSFYATMNAQFMNNDYKNYEPFVKALYKGLEKNFLQSKTDVILYRCQFISKSEFDKLEQNLNNNKKVHLYSRAFLSFSINKTVAHNFIKKEKCKEDLVPIKLIIKPKNEGEIFSSNADIQSFSVYNEEEILFYPFSSFIIDENMQKEIINGVPSKVIILNYLGKYEKEIKLQISETFNKKNNLEEDISIIDKGLEKKWKFTEDVLHKSMTEKFSKNLDEIKSLLDEEMKDVLKGKSKKKKTNEETETNFFN